MNELDRLIQILRKQCGFTDDDCNFCTPEQTQKFVGSDEPGCRVKVTWDKSVMGCVDYGCLFTLPGLEEMDIWMGGVVFIPRPDNPSGKDAPPPVWTTLDELLKNPLCVRVEVLA